MTSGVMVGRKVSGVWSSGVEVVVAEESAVGVKD
jgi:hypothetical protein